MAQPGENNKQGNPAVSLPIDLVCPWLDDTDPAWQWERAKYREEDWGNPDTFFRDWGLMRYWFRGVERALPWIRTIHFVTWGHLPPWLNTAHPRLHIVRHEEFIPQAYLPTFSSYVITLNLFRIEGLSEQFILANDDMFWLDRMDREMYFKEGLPCDCLCLEPITEVCTDNFGFTLWNNISALNRHYDLQECLRQRPALFYSDAYPERVLRRNRELSTLLRYPGLEGDHLPIPLLRSVCEEVWGKEGDALDLACRQRFRGQFQLNEWLYRYWGLASGRFTPGRRGGISLRAGDSVQDLKAALLSGRYPVVCINEGRTEEFDFTARRDLLHRLLALALPEPSSFER